MDHHGLTVEQFVHRDRRRDEVLPWDHISAGLHEDFLWGEWTDALAAAGTEGLPLDPVLRLRGLHGLRARARRRLRRAAGGRQPGDRPGPRHRWGRAGDPHGRSGPHRGPGREDPVTTDLPGHLRLRFTKTGKIRWTSHRDVARMWERALRTHRAAPGLQRRLLPAPEGQLRPGPPHRPRVGLRVPRPRAAPGSRGPGGDRRSSDRGPPRRARRHGRRGHRPLRALPAGGGAVMHMAVGRRPRPARRRGAGPGPERRPRRARRPLGRHRRPPRSR